MSEPETGHLVVCPTPIGNLEDVTLRVLSALRTVDLVACEDTRRTRKLLDRHDVGAKLVSYHEHNERKRSAELVDAMRSGKKVALVSDSGTPLVSDPGYALVRACVAAGLEVEVLPGPSAALTALVASGLPPDRWRFAGFLPRKKTDRRKTLEEPGGTLVAFESPNRLPSTLALLAEIDPRREAAVCRELDEGARRGHPRHRRRAARPLHRGAEGRDRACCRSRRRRPRDRPARRDRSGAPPGRRRREAARGREGRGRPDGRERERAL